MEKQANSKTYSMMLMQLISIFNIYKIIDCYKWVSRPRTFIAYDGLGTPSLYIGGVIVALVLQIINILLLTLALKRKEKISKFIGISACIIVVTFFIPIYKFPILYPYHNLYNMIIFK